MLVSRKSVTKIPKEVKNSTSRQGRGGGIHTGQEACLPTVIRTLTLDTVPVFGYSEFPPRKESLQERSLA